MQHEPDYIIDIAGLEVELPDGVHADRQGRRWLGVRFDCCNVYNRLYKNPTGNAYVGRCPRCFRRAIVKVGPGGCRARFFRAS